MCIIPYHKLLNEFENSISTSDLLKYITLSGDFKLITYVQIIVNIMVVSLESTSSKYVLETDQDYEKVCSSNFGKKNLNNRISLVFMLLFFHVS